MTGARVLLMTLSCRTSKAGRLYLAGWVGKASVVAFAGEPDKFGNETWDVYLSEPEPRDAAPKAAARPPGREEPPASPAHSSLERRGASWGLPGRSCWHDHAAATLPPRGRQGQAGEGERRGRVRLRAGGRSGRSAAVLTGP
jgi:hypothetical protein